MKEGNIITADTLIQRNDTKFLANKLGEEMVMMDMESGNFVSVNAIGAYIWSVCESPVAVADVVKHLETVYDIAHEQCTAETLHFLNSGASEQMFLVRTGK